MTGIPLQVRRVDGTWETVWLSTARLGPVGENIGEIKARCRELRLKYASASKLAALVGVAVGNAKEATMDELEKLSRRQDEAMAEMHKLEPLLIAACEELGKAALAANYGHPEAIAILNLLTDAQVLKIPAILESGETPQDFFPSNARPPSAPGMLPKPVTGAPSASATAPSRQKE